MPQFNDSLSFNRTDIKDRDRDEIASLTESFLSSGGVITSFDIRPVEANKDHPWLKEPSLKRRAKSRAKNLNRLLIKELRNQPPQLIDATKVLEITGLSKTQLRSWSHTVGTVFKDVVLPVACGKNPRGPRLWQLADIIDWCDEMDRVSKGG